MGHVTWLMENQRLSDIAQDTAQERQAWQSVLARRKPQMDCRGGVLVQYNRYSLESLAPHQTACAGKRVSPGHMQ